jgi:two-component system sensor histidine kinase DctS
MFRLNGDEAAEREQQRQELISDTLSMEAQVSARVEVEGEHLQDLARLLAERGTRPEAFAALPEVQRGLHRFWISLTWLDAGNRIVAHVPEQLPPPDPASLPLPSAERPSGLSAHQTAPLPTGGKLVARYSPTDLLRQTVPWWLARKYDVRVVDSYGGVVASTGDGPELPGRETYRISMAPLWDDSFLELSARDRITPWFRKIPGATVAGFVALIVFASWMLRRQMQGVLRAERAWRTEVAWRSAMEDSLTVGLRARDLEGRMVYMNRAMADMVGYEPEALLGRLPPMPYWPPDSLEASMMRHRRNLAGQAPREGYETAWIHASGRRVDVMVFEAPLVDAGGRHIGWMGSILDITERKRLEERERRQTESMAHNARLTMLGEVASTLAHELNQPLTAIASYSAGVSNTLQRQPGTEPAVLRALQRLGEQAAHAGRIVQRIREFLTRREPRLESCDLNQAVDSGVALLRRELDRQQVRLELRLDPSLPPVVADSVLMEQVIINLVRNAGDALAARPDERRIEVRSGCSADRRFVRIDVADNGPGLGGRRIEQLCTPFYSTKAEGMGMGLAICRSILEAHQGVFDAGEAPGGGALFSFTLQAELQAGLQAVTPALAELG